MKTSLIVLFCLAFVNVNAQLHTEYAPAASMDSFVNALFGSSNVQIFNVQTTAYSGSVNITTAGEYQYLPGSQLLSIGSFEFNNSSIGIDKGIMLTGGNLDPPYGLSVPSSNSQIGVTYGPGDSLLDNIIAPFHTANCAVLEFDFIPNGDSVKFNYVFASDEYPTQICSKFSDVFAFHVSGPGIAGQQNIALIPGTNIPVGINSINDTSITNLYTANFNLNNCQSVSYPHYYVDHTNDQHFIFNGSTSVLTASVATIPCQTYHLRFAIGEGFDGGGYSAVFLEANSFNSEPLSISSDISYGNGDTLLYEDCGSAKILFKRTYNIQQAKTYNITIGGSASNGLDYNMLPSQITMPAGSDSAVLYIIPTQDNLSDDNESIILTIGDTLCNGNYYESDLHLVIHEKPNYQVQIFPDTGVFCQETIFHCEVDGAIEPISYSWNNGASLSDSFIFYPKLTSDYQKSTIYVTVLDACENVVSDTIDVFFSKKPQANFIFSPDWIDLLNSNVIFTDHSSSDVVEWKWKFGDDEDSSSLQNPVHFYSEVGDYIVSLKVKNKYNCLDSTNRKINVNEIPSIYIPNSFTPNHDGINDVFKIYCNEAAKIEVSIYNRWGEEIFQSKNKKFEWCGEDAPDGTYTYKVIIKFKDKQTKIICGVINLIR